MASITEQGRSSGSDSGGGAGRGSVYVVTGGAGFVGSNLIAALLKREPRAKIIAVDDFRSGSFRNIVEMCERCESGPFAGEVIAESTASLDWASLLDDLRPAAVHHMASITDTTVDDEGQMLRDNVDGFRGLLYACVERDVPLVYASSAATYGTPPQTFAKEPFPLRAAGSPNNIYGFSKWLLESLHREVAAQVEKAGAQTPRVVGLRFFNVFGPGERCKGKMASMVYKLTRDMLDGKQPRIFEDGEQARDQVFVDDVVGCLIAAADGLHVGSATPGVYNLGSGRATSFNRLIDIARAAIGATHLETQRFPMPADIRAFYQDFTCADMSATREGLGWSPRHDPELAISSYARWLAVRRESGAAI